MLDAIRPLMHRSARPEAHLRPFVSDAGGKRSLQFTVSAIQSQFDLAAPGLLDLEYTRLMAAFLLVQPAPRAIAMIGLGGGSLALFCRRLCPQAQLAVAEINPHVIAQRQRFGVPPDDERFVVAEVDGAELVRHLDHRADVLLVDGYTAEGLPRQLSSQGFFDDCAAALAPGGVLVANVFADARRTRQVEARIARSFGGLSWVVPDGDDTNHIVFAVRPPEPTRARRAPPRQHLAPPQRLPGMDDQECPALQQAFTRVHDAWHGQFAPDAA